MERPHTAAVATMAAARCAVLFAAAAVSHCCVDGLNSAERSSNQSVSVEMKTGDLNRHVYHRESVCMRLSAGCSIRPASLLPSK